MNNILDIISEDVNYMMNSVYQQLPEELNPGNYMHTIKNVLLPSHIRLYQMIKANIEGKTVECLKKHT